MGIVGGIGGPELLGLLFGIILCIVLGNCSSSIARKKGYSSLAFFWLGFFFWPVPIILLFVKDKNVAKRNMESDNANLLLTYKQLLDSGAISQDEFDRKKGEILGAAQLSK